MAKQSCCHKKKLRRGLWSPEEDEKLMNHIAKYGHGCWSSVPKLAGLERCGKSCRLRWINYLRPDLKRGTFSQEEEDVIIHLHSMLGNKWSQIAAQLPGRTDNEVKNFWNSYIKKKLRERGIDPATHKPLADPGGGGGRVITSTATPTACCAVFTCDAELVPTTMPVPAPPLVPVLDGLKTPLDWPVAIGSAETAKTPLSGYQTSSFACYLDLDALHCSAIPAVGVPSASSSSTLNSAAGLSPAAPDEQCTFIVGTDTPWHIEQHNGALDELKWSDYFDGAFQCAASHGLQGQCIYEDSKDAVQFDCLGLSNWC